MATPQFERRHFIIGAAAASTVVLAGCGSSSTKPASVPPTIGPRSSVVGKTERRRASTGKVASFDLVAGLTTLDLAGTLVQTWAYNDQVPGPTLRLGAGDTLAVSLRNELPESTTIHWHGLAIRNDMDGVPGVTQDPIAAASSFDYRFIVPDPGTYWFHPHMGLQLDRALYAPLIIEDPDEPSAADVDEVIVIDDWLDGIDDATPEQALEDLKSMGSMGTGGGMDMGGGTGSMVMAQSDLLGGDAGDVPYPMHLINGRPPADRQTIEVPRGGRIRLRLINAGSDTAYRVALGGHQMTVTHADGFPVEPVTVDAVLLGMGERYDVTVDVASGAWPLVAAAEGKDGHAAAVVRTRDAQATSAPQPDAQPKELAGRILSYGDLVARDDVRLDARDPDVEQEIELTGSMQPFSWAFDGTPYPDGDPLVIEQGQRVRMTFTNTTSMWHPIHLHGHTFRVTNRPDGPRKDTVNVLPDESVIVDFEADNPGQWMIHCHNAYHLEGGMAMITSYQKSAGG